MKRSRARSALGPSFRLWALLVAVGVHGVAWGAEPAAAAPATGAPAEIVPVLGAGSMSAASTALDQILLEVLLRAEPPVGVRSIAGGLDAAEASMALEAAATRERLDAPDAAPEMRDARATWSITVNTLRGEQRELADYAETLAGDLAILDAAREQWSAGRAALPADAPPSLLTLADGALASIEAARVKVSGHNVEALQAVLRLAALQATASLVLDVVDQAVRDVLFSRDSAPVWALPLVATPIDEVVRIASGSARQRAQDVATYMLDSPWRALVQILVGLLASWLFLRARELPEERRPSRAHPTWNVLVDRPIASAILLALGAGTALHLRAPSAFLDLQVAIAIVPLVRVLGVLLPSAVLRPMYLLFAVYAVNRLAAMVAGAGTAYRAALIAADLLALVAMLWAVREQARQASPAAESSTGGLRWLLLGAVGGAGIALAANLIGFVALATVIVDGSLEALYIAAILWATVALLDGCMRFAARLPAAQQLGMVRNHEDRVENRLGQLLRLAGALAWCANMVFLLSLGQPLSEGARTALAVGLTVGTINLSVGGVLAFLVSLGLAVALSRFLRFALDEDVLPRMHLPKGVPATVLTLTHYAVIAAGVCIALAAAGAHIEQFAFAAGALGIGIGFGLQSIVNNLVSGLILLFERPIQVGDVIELGTLTGTIQHIGMRACRVRTLDGAEVIVPNSDLLTDRVVNWTLSDPVRRFDVKVGVAYGSRPEEVIALLQEVVIGTPGVLERPAPETLLDGFGDSSVDFLIRAWAPYEEHIATRSATRVRIEAALRDAGVSIPYPQRDLHVRSIDPAALATLASGAAQGPAQSE